MNSVQDILRGDPAPIRHCLTGKLLGWYHSHGGKFPNWNIFVEVVIAKVIRNDAEFELEYYLRTRKQGPNQTAADFVRDIFRMAPICMLTQREAKQRITINICLLKGINPNLAMAMMNCLQIDPRIHPDQ